MEPLIFAHADVHLQVEHGILEVFMRNRIIGSYRAPVKWVKVRAETRKGGLTRLHFGNIKELDEPLYAGLTGAQHLLTKVEIETADEPRYRAFFSELARQADRRVGG
ncbi:hypothetical protein [Streptomyces sp. SID13031]|uniref:hypothetical protein n=1 Tax=Streptomyces sp. SID13031 TaxID=2706046 RepID=UPI0013C9B56A|nr:hypothetical protein [Streptomyces sp. SID13031]NEA36430.1 hypothetical protein [Streptomyces sp. SID13031]